MKKLNSQKKKKDLNKEDEEWQDIGDDPTDYLMYEFQGYMCRGSGAERVYVIREL